MAEPAMAPAAGEHAATPWVRLAHCPVPAV